MNHGKYYKGIDLFRLIGAILVITIHTSPLNSYNDTANFILTRILARVAVPFFFMTSGFFLFAGYGNHSEALKKIVKKTTLLYGLAILLYIPLNIYNGYFLKENLLPEIIRDLVFDGTIYHLWYFPATILGAAIAWVLVRKFRYRTAFLCSLLLYVIGVFGDSYYGITEQIPVLKGFYALNFQISNYTRNGIFFAPVFFILGGIISKKANKPSSARLLIPSIISFSLLLVEGLILHERILPHHDSMYLMLIPCMYCLFSLLVKCKGKQVFPLRLASLIIYIIHPLMIVVIRMLSKPFGLEKYFVENSLLHFLSVTILSVAAALLFIILFDFYKSKRHAMPFVGSKDRAWLEVDLNHLKHNARILKKALPKHCQLMAVVKADAYGHGAAVVSECLNDIGVKAFAVATIAEGIDLRKNGITGTILIMGYTHPSRAKDICNYHLTQSLIDYEYAKCLNKAAYPIEVHIKIDTGMHRLGLDVAHIEQIEHIFNMKYLKVCGIYTHLCVSESHDKDDIRFTQGQIAAFSELLGHLEKQKIPLPMIHVQSSYGLLNYPELMCNYVRTGIALYGTLSSVYDNPTLQLDLRPVLSLKSRVALIRTLEEHESVGYGRTYCADSKRRIAVLPVGYADGIPRAISLNGAMVLIHGTYAPVIGMVCMDQLIVDITEIPDVSTGDIVTLIGTDRDASISITEVSDHANSIANELLSRMGRRLNIIYKY